MDRIRKIQKKIEEIERILGDIKRDLEDMSKEKQEKVPKSTKKTQKTTLPDEETLKREYEQLYEWFKEGNREEIDKYFQSKNTEYIKAFCKANYIQVESSKKKMIDNIIVSLAQRKAILGD